jgi:hypothetical protein
MFGFTKKPMVRQAHQPAPGEPTPAQLDAVMDSTAIIMLPNGWGNLNGEYIQPSTVQSILRTLFMERPTRHFNSNGRCTEIIQRGLEFDSHYRDRHIGHISDDTWRRMKADQKAGINPEEQLNESLNHLYKAMGDCVGATADEFAAWLEAQR